MQRFTLLLLAALSLNGCFDSDGDNTPHNKPNDEAPSIGTTPVVPPTTPIEPPSASGPAHLLEVYMAQTHVLRPTDRFFRLVSKRDALFIARVESDTEVLTIEVLDSLGRSLGNLALKGSAQLDKTAGNHPAPFTLAHSVRIPGDWVLPGMQIRLMHGQQQLTLERPNVGAPNVLTFYGIPIVLYGKAIDSLPPNSLVMSPKYQEEYAARLPVSRFDYKAMPALELDKLVVRPNGQSPGEFLPVQPSCSSAQPQGSGCDFIRVFNAVYEYLGLLMAANGDYEVADYYGAVIADNLFSGVGGNSRGTGIGWGGLMHHEMGHAYGLGHAHEEYQKAYTSEFNSHFPSGSKQFPYAASLPGDDNGNIGDTWGYDLNRREFISPYIYNPDGTIKRHKGDPSSFNGGMDLEPGHIYTMFSDSNVSRIQTHLEGYGKVLGKIHYDPDSNQPLRWNYDQNRYDEVPYPTPCAMPPSCSGPGDLPIERNVPVLTLFGSISRTSPELTLINTPYAHEGNLIRLYDPTLASDIQELSKQYASYCIASGCQYVLRLSERINGQVHQRHILLRAGFFAPFRWEINGLRSGADDPNSSDSLTRWAVNIRSQDNLEKVEVLFKDHAENGLVPGEGEVITSWTVP